LASNGHAVQAYFNALPADRKPLAEQLHGIILALFPEVTVDLSYRMPTYRVGKGWVALANQKHYVSLYTCSTHHLTWFRKRHPEIRTGKGCINFRPDVDLPVGAVEQVIRHAIEQPAPD
jgi:uncharacterized protein YdhG (YjbR/CyaY superfamily)